MSYGQSKYPDWLGEPELLEPANPAAGAFYTLTVPAQYVYIIESIRFTLTTAIAAANRQPEIKFYNPGPTLFLNSRSSLLQTASLAWNWNCWSAGPAIAPVQAGLEIHMVFCNHILPHGWQMAIDCLALAAADQFSNIKIYVRRWRLL